MHRTRIGLMHSAQAHPPSGQLMVFFSILLVMLLGFAGLVIDIGRLHASHREAQNAADAAALAAAMAKFRKLSDSAALAEANLLRLQNSPSSLALALNAGLQNSLNIPPLQGPHQGDPEYVEAYVTVPLQTFFVHLLGIGQNYNVAARAVAGQEPPSEGEGVIVLDPQRVPGITVTGAVNNNGSTSNTILKVNGGVLVNSLGGGYNQWGQPIDTYPASAPNTGQTTPGISTQTTNQTPEPSFEAKYVTAAGGTSSTNAAHYKFYGDPDYPNGINPLIAGTGLMFPDPLRSFPVPQPGADSRVDVTLRDQSNDSTPDGVVSLGTGDVDTLQPGLYRDIMITGSAQVTFAEGIYIISPSSPNQGLTINGSPTIIGHGVMFYITGSNYITNNEPPGYWDALDDSTNNQLDGPLPSGGMAAPTSSTVWNTVQGQQSNPPGTDPYSGTVRYATVNINVGDGVLDLRGLANTGGAFDNMLFFARRRNNQTIKIAGNAGSATINLDGVVYAKWAPLDISGGGRWTAQFVVGSMKVSGGAVVTIEGFGYSWGLVKKVFLVE